MFTGIIRHKGTVQRLSTDADTSVLIISAALPSFVERGSSIAINGVCLTVTEVSKEDVSFDIMPVTLDKTTLGSLAEGHDVNLEPALRMGDEIGGHFVYGHVDGIGMIKERKEEEGSVLLEIAIPKDLMKYMAMQGSVALDGVSLTIAGRSDTTITVSLVEYTLQHTTLSNKETGDTLNIEADMLMKQVVDLR